MSDQPIEAFRIVADLMNYEYLGERRTNNSADNFQSLMCDILENARDASLTFSAREYLNSPNRALHQQHSATEHRDAVLAYWCVQRQSSAPQG